MKAVVQRAVTVDKARQVVLMEGSVHSMPSSTLLRGQSVGAAQTRTVDYEMGKTYGQLDADQYYGGLQGEASHTCCFVTCMSI